jgi:hypothetical protein
VRFDFQLYHPTKGTLVHYQNEPIFSSFSDGDVFKGQRLSASRAKGLSKPTEIAL